MIGSTSEGAPILVVDDVPANLMALQAVLQPLGQKVVCARSGKEALRILFDQEFAVILLDVSMPDLDGFETAALIRARGRTRRIPIIFLTATQADERFMARAYERGAVDFLIKPFNPDILRAKVSVFVELYLIREQMRQLAAQEVRRAAAEAGRQRLYRIFMQTPAAIAVQRGPGHLYELANPIYRRLAGDRELTGRTFRDAMPELAAQGYDRLLDSVFRSGEPYVATEQLVSISLTGGRRIEGYFNFAIQPFRDAEGQIEGVITFGYDVTPQVHARTQMEMANRQIAASEKRFRSLVAASAQVVWTRNALGVVMEDSPSWFAFTGQTSAEYRGHGWREAIHPDDRAVAVAAWEESVRSRSAHQAEYRLRRPDGSYTLTLTRAVPVLDDDDDHVREWVGTNTDVAKERQAEAEREQLLRELQQAVRARDDFLMVASHELRTPLTSLQLTASSVMRQLERSAGQTIASDGLRDRMRTVARQLNRLEQLIKGLLDVSRIAAGRLALEMEQVDLADLTREVLDRFHDELTRQQVDVSLSTERDVIGRWDRSRLDQIITNLLTNALKYGEGRPILVSVQALGERVRLVVRDHGIGIPHEQQQRIFGKFERAASERNYAGLGLGLWITRELVELMHGTICVQSEPGRGSTFVVELPRR